MQNEIRNIFESFRRALNEAEEEGKDKEKTGGIPYSKQDELYQNSLKTAKEQFGADFTRLENPMFYYNEDGDVSLSGEIPSLNNAKFQFRYKDPSGQGCFLWTNSLILSDENIRKISRIYGVYKNWKQELSSSEDIRPMNYRKS